MKPVIFVIDGTDYSGKTTQTTLLYNALSSKYNGVIIKTPSRDKEGQDLLRRVYQDICSKDEAFELFMQNNKHVSEIVRTEYKYADFAVLDRFFLSTLAYHSAFLGKDLTSEVKKQIN